MKSTDAREARALVHEIENVDIYSNSWGPGDPGWRVQGPGRLASEALKRGIDEVIVRLWRTRNSKDKCIKIRCVECLYSFTPKLKQVFKLFC